MERRTLLSIAAPAFAANYQPVWTQDFTAQSSLSVNASGPVGADGSTWMAHKPGGGDFFPFSDPAGSGNPFTLDANGLTIRAQQNGASNNGFDGFTGGLLSSVDHDGDGFAQQYGYFEISMRAPGGANTWPAFWLLSRNDLVNRAIDGAEIDVTESYGNYGAGPGNSPAGDPNVTTAAWHQWNADGTNASDGHATRVGGLTADYHTYGVDVEPTGLTYYVDRQVAWTAQIFAAATQPMYVLVDLALGGGSFNNASGTGYDYSLTPAVSDLNVKYVAVWASPSSPNFNASLSSPASGTTIGTRGSWLTGDSGVYAANDGANAAFDGNVNTYFDAPASTGGNGDWVGEDLGSPKLITELSYAPRAGFNDRMRRGVIQASNSPDFSSGVVTLYTIATTPTNGLHTVAVNSGTAFRYVRYASSPGGWGNIAELSVKTLNAPAVVTGVTASGTTGSQVGLAWNAVDGATSYAIARTANGGPRTIVASNVTSTAYVDATVSPGVTYAYTVAAVDPSGTGGDSVPASATPAGATTADLVGATIGTPGSWLTGDTGVLTARDGATAAFDGDLATAFDAPPSTGGNAAWTGEDLGAAKLITEVRFAPRNGFIGRMIGGKFQASNTADFSSSVDLYTITGTPAAGLQTVTVSPSVAYRYVRYLSPDGGWGNIAELGFRGTTPSTPPPPTPVPPTPTPTLPAAPTSLVATAISTSEVDLAWTDVAVDETAYLVERKNADGTWTQVASLAANTTSYASVGLTAGTPYAFRVRAANAVGASGYSNEATATTASPPVVPPPTPTPTPTPTPSPSTPIVVSSITSTGSRQSVAGTAVSLATDAPGGNWLWGAGWNWAAPFVSASWDAPNVPVNAIDLPEENTAVGVSIASTGAYVKPTTMGVAATLYPLGGYGSKIGLGFWSSMPPRADGGSSLAHFTGVVLDQAAGTLQVYVDGTAAGATASVGPIVGNVGYALRYSIDTTTGTLSNVTFAGRAIAGLSSVGFTSAATSFAGVMDAAASRAAFGEFSVG